LPTIVGTVELHVGQTIADRYRIEERLGSGAMGIVYRARHTKLARPFAIKVLHPHLTANAKLRKRFQREAETASALRHRNVVGVVDIGETDDLVFLVMELAEGHPLSTAMHEAPLSAARVIEYAKQLCEGLQHAHDTGLIHRDFKPDNVIVETDRGGNQTLRIIDFGIAVLRDRASTEREKLTTEGVVLGTPHYMAPEHATGEEVDHRIDLFALGVILYEMLTGKMPFDGDGVDVARSNLLYDPPAMAERAPYLNIDPLLEAFTRTLMARERDLRFASAKVARSVLELIASDREAAAYALGIDDDELLEVEPLTRDVMAMPTIARTRTRPSSTLEPIITTPTVIATDKLPQVRRRRAAWLAGLAVLIAGSVLAVAMTRPREIEAIAEAPEPEPTPLAQPVRTRVSEPAPPPAPIDAPVAATTMIKPRITTAAPRLVQETPSVTPTASVVAALYGSVGRALGHLQQAKGSDATIDLWPRFRHIRINDAIATAESRTETDRALRKLQIDIDARK